MKKTLAYLGIGELSSMLRSREISPVELTAYYVNRISELNPQLNVFIEIAAERAKAQAQAAEFLMDRGQFIGPLHGIPFALKDLIDVKGLVTTGGSILRRTATAQTNAYIADRLFEAGAVMLGKTHMVEFAFGGTGVNHHYGTPWNPWDSVVQRLPGGSSSGSAVAVAAGLSPIAIGSDTGGSVRIPASFCGVVGLKPTFGTVSNQGVLPLDPTLDSLGPLAHNVEDCALLHGIISGQESNGSNSLLSGAEMVNGDVEGLRMCFPREYFWADVDEEVEVAVRASAQVFSDLNVVVDEISLECLDDLSVWRRGPNTTAVESYFFHRTELERDVSQFDPIVSARMLEGRDVSAVDYLEQRRNLEDIRYEAMTALESVDFLITPTTPFPAPPLSEVDNDEDYHKINGMCLRNTSAVNLLGLCAISVPCGLTRGGLPIGLQLIGKPYDEKRLLRIAYAYEQSLGLIGFHPETSAFT
jgi:aspartyl-tRNA(Asn)/glutamyl-tRNA(Gln) amidotransferase subunit A